MTDKKKYWRGREVEVVPQSEPLWVTIKLPDGTTQSVLATEVTEEEYKK